MQRVVYPAIFDPTAVINHIQVTVPDVPSVKVLGTNNADAVSKASDAIGKALAKTTEVPVPSAPFELTVEAGQSINFIVLDLDEYRESAN
ncbi:hypothetical protein [Secundilactobacillus similis]|uniref:HicB-like antitoxin of toxin-antitoxin system domain-containing protein n=1 Tax=Secundilactobacillus similis DSM 23365 = JCM 2765 TaxID=1423804 RepID=A0A0R2EXX1_9LACO|nr:hypothetical protein [Secundilactobacillus similis]KRN21169.1 hypothetical protein FD14_GL001292 [Secundilactobacillus similis DSM 23365 = JCM 2765]